MGVLPLGAGVSAGIVYAIVWLGLAAKTPSERRLDVTLRAVTSVLVLAPLIWEATVRFQAVSTWTAAAVLSCFTILGLVVSWRKNVAIIAWIALLAGVFTAWGLVLGTRDVFPFALALLAMAAAVEVSACLEHWLPERWVAAAGTNLGVLLLTYLAAQKTIPESYVALPAFAAPAAQAALLGIYLTSTIVRTLFRGFPFTSFETTQCAAVFLIAVGGAMTAGEGPGAVALAMPAFTLLCGAACYVVAFAHLDRHGERNRNFYTYSVFGLLLTLTGSWMLLGPAALAVTWSALALSCIVAGGLWDRLTLRWHGSCIFCSRPWRPAPRPALAQCCWARQPAWPGFRRAVGRLFSLFCSATPQPYATRGTRSTPGCTWVSRWQCPRCWFGTSQAWRPAG
jgi:hypothetical protein